MQKSSFFVQTSLCDSPLRCFWSSPNTFIVEFPGGVSRATSQSVFALQRSFASALAQFLPSDCMEFVPAFTTLTLAVDWRRLEALGVQEFALEEMFEKILEKIFTNQDGVISHIQPPIVEGRTVEIPVCYAEECAPDAAELYERCGLGEGRMIAELHAGAEYMVAMIGFTPGFPYLLGLPSELVAPRKSTPRLRVEAGSVGVAGAQSGVYPFASPGGWNIIGRTPLRLFCAEWREPSLLRFGDCVRFIPISLEDFHRQAEREAALTQFFFGVSSSDKLSDNHKRFAVVRRAGVQTSVQDGGRVGYRALGVPESGAADKTALALANILVGNPPDCAALECAFGGFALAFEKERLAAFAGADMNASLTANGKTRRIEPYRAFYAPAGAELRLGNRNSNDIPAGARAYLAVAGGIEAAEHLGSRSAYPLAQMGGLRGGAYLQKGDVLHLQRLEPSGISAGILCRVRASSRAETPRLNLNALLSLLEARESKQSSGGVALRLRFVRGAQWEDFSESARQDFLGGQFVVLPESNRMGVRLKPVSLPNEKTTEETLALAAARNAGAMISRAVFPGAAQVPPDGNPIVLLADAQTTGGYPVIASVIQPDIGKLAQARAGDRIAWEEISLGEARELERQWEQTMRRYRAALRIYALG